ncbi:MAG: hypothetical protein R3E21_10280 [Caenibius sp.]
MKCRANTLPVLILAGLALSGCASDSARYPSLAIRDVEKASEERVHGTLQPAGAQTPTSPPIPASTDLASRLQQLDSDARAAHNDFLAMAPSAKIRAEAARGAAPGSDSWFAALLALAELDSLHGRLMTALSDLDALHVEAELDGAGRPEVSSTQNAIETLAAEESGTITSLAAQLRVR